MAKSKKLPESVNKSLQRSRHQDRTMIQPHQLGVEASATLYNEALQKEYRRVQHPETLSLDNIQDEIVLQVKVSQQSIFKIGELLHLGKKQCQQKGIGFQEWIENHFKDYFSYETARNFIKVYERCFGMRDIAMKVPPSILYKISAPSFPDELFNYLFEQGNLDEMTNGMVNGILEKYRQDGMRAVRADMDDLSQSVQVHQQTYFTVRLCSEALKVLDNLRKQVEARGTDTFYQTYFNEFASDEPIAREINMKLYMALLTSIRTLEPEIENAEQLLKEIAERVHGQYSETKALSANAV